MSMMMMMRYLVVDQVSGMMGEVPLVMLALVSLRRGHRYAMLFDRVFQLILDGR